METVLLIVVMGAAVYFLMIRPQQKRAKEQQNLMSALEPGARVMTVSGIIGTIKYLGDKQAIIEISPGVEMTVDKRAISTQKVEDEFEYADDDAEPAAELEAADQTPLADGDQTGPVQDALDLPTEPTEPGDTAWDNPDTPKN